MMKVTSVIDTLPDDSDRLKQPATVTVASHWNYKDRVNLLVPNGSGDAMIITLPRVELIKAIENACNHRD